MSLNFGKVWWEPPVLTDRRMWLITRYLGSKTGRTLPRKRFGIDGHPLSATVDMERK